MKTQLVTIGIAIMLASGISSCKKDDTTPVNQSSTAYSNPIMNGKWAVDFYELNGAEHTDFYAPYTFSFKNNDVVVVSGAGNQTTGKWSITTVKDKKIMMLDLGTSDPLNLLNNSAWNISEQTDARITMDGKRGDDGTAKLVLKKL